MRRLSVISAVLIALSACSSPERVTVQAPISTVTTQTPLDSQTINNFLGALIRLNQIEIPEGSSFAFEPRVFDDQGRYSPFSANKGILVGLDEQQQEAGRIIDAAGLGTPDEFLAIGDRIYRAYAAIVLEQEAASGSADASQLESIAATVPQTDRAAVRQYFEQLSEVIDPD